MFIKLSGEIIRQIRFVLRVYLRLMSSFKKCRNFVTFIKVSGEIIRQIRFVRRVYLRLYVNIILVERGRGIKILL